MFSVQTDPSEMNQKDAGARSNESKLTHSKYVNIFMMKKFEI